MSKIQNYINYIADPRARRSIRSLFSHFMNDDEARTFKDIVFGNGTTILSLSGTFTTGLLISGAGATPISITGAFTTGISIAADGTTGISITSAFSGVTGLSFAGTASGDGILISGVCADGIHISGSNTVSGLHISGDQVVGILFESTAPADAALRATIPTGITLGAGVDINCTSTGVVTSGLTMQGTGTFTTGITLSATAITTGILISATTVTTGVTISSACSGDGILISGACADGIHVSGTNTATAIHISGDQVIGILYDVDAAATDGIKILVDDGITLTTGINIDRSGTTGICTTAISIDTDGTTGIEIAAGFTGVTAISLAGTGSTAGINISGNHTTAITIGAQTTAGISITGATATGISITGACSTAALQIGVSGTPAGDFVWYGTTAAYVVTFDADGDTNGSVLIGADTKGLMFSLYGDVTGCGVFWDPTTDTNGTLSIGAAGGAKGNDFLAYGATSGNYLQWDQSADDLLLVGTATQLAVAGTTDSTDSITGSLRTAGGLGVALNASIGGYLKTASVRQITDLGTTPVGTVTIVEYGDGKDITTVLTLTNFIVGTLAGAAAALAMGNIVYAFPAGQHLELVYALSSIVLTAAGTAVATDTGLGSVIASGAVAALVGTATFEDRLTGQTINTAAGGGTAVSALTAATAGIGTGIALNVAGSVKNVFLNSAGTWNVDNTGNLTASGTIVLKWSKMS